MPTVIDYNQLAIAAVMAEAYGSEQEIDWNFCRHIILNSIRMYHTRHRNKYGQTIIACDGANNWRKRVFPQYKAARKKNRDESPIDWDMLYNVLHSVRKDLRDHFPFRVIHVEGVEADDIIGMLAFQAVKVQTPLMIVSGDKDFQQLQQKEDDFLPGSTPKYVLQYAPAKKEEIVCEDPDEFLAIHILKGDSGDGIPNVLSPDDVFLLEGVRQSPVSAKMKSEWMDHWINGQLDDSFFAEYERGNVWQSTKKKGVDVHEIKRNYERNRQLIDLRMIPKELKASIAEAVVEPPRGNFESVMMYFGENDMGRLLDCIDDFV